MGTILARRRSDGTTAYMGKIILRRGGEVIHRESKTFSRHREAKAWLAAREAEIAQSGPPQPSATLAEAITRYMDESRREIGRTKRQVLAAILAHPIARLDCRAVTSQEITAWAAALGKERKPQTVANYVSHLASVFQIAGPAWGYPLDPQQIDAARKVSQRLGLTAKSQHRDRRPTLDEIERLIRWFEGRDARSLPMHRVVGFALFSTRRQDEITRIAWDDLEPGRVLVRAMKHPGGTAGNDVWVDLPPEAEAIARAMPRVDDRIFPFTTDAISAAFTRATRILGIEGLHFHDLRHEGITRLFEMGRTIPHVAAVSGHRNWQSLQRYTHIRQTGDRWAGVGWLETVTRPQQRPSSDTPACT